jgi:MOSC domain-containing protein YiiM
MVERAITRRKAARLQGIPVSPARASRQNHRMRCPDCGHHPDDYTPSDLASTLDLAGTLWGLILDRVDPGLAARGTPSPVDLRERSVAAVLSAGDDLDSRQEALHRLAHDLTRAGRLLHEYGGTPAAGATGVLDSINASRGGVPKSAVLEAEVGRLGLHVDQQANRRHHGRPWQALSLWSLDLIRRLNDEGHPVRPGSCGENVTVAGIDWAVLRPGMRLGIGEVVAELSSYAIPCAKIRESFAGHEFNRIHHEKHPGWSRMYAWVVRGGTIRPGDPVVVEP